MVAKDTAKARFDAALDILNFGERCHALSKLGKDIKSANLAADALEQLLDHLAGDPAAPAPAFNERARLVVVKATGCATYARKILDHPSQSVRYEAVKGKGLLLPEDAKAAFLSNDSSRKLKKFLVKCDALPCDAEVMDHAWQTFGEKDKDFVWEVLQRVTDEQVAYNWLQAGETEMVKWLEELKDGPEGLAPLARRFPNIMIHLVKEGTIKWSWFWAKEILDTNPMLVLRATFIDGAKLGSGPHKGYHPQMPRQDFFSTLGHWGWRRKSEMMLEICREMKSKCIVLADCLMNVTSTRHPLTMNNKLDLLLRMWSQLPDADKDGNHDGEKMALRVVKHLPVAEERRPAELERIISAIWKVVDEVGRRVRKELLVGPEHRPCCTELLRTFADKLPPRHTVDQFFHLLKDYEAPEDSYKFVMGCCKTHDGRHDELMQKVFQRYLGKEELDGAMGTKLFQILLADAKSQDVIQASFEMLIEFLGNQMESNILRAVVARMATLEVESHQKDSKIPKAALPIPVDWASLVPRTDCLGGEVHLSPHADFLHRVLHSGMGEQELLGKMVQKYGRYFFWDSLGHVLDACAGKVKSELARAVPTPDMKLLAEVDVVRLCAPLPQGKQGLGRAASAKLARKGSKDATFGTYFAEIGEGKKKLNAKDPSVRCEGYKELIGLAMKEDNLSATYEEMLPYLIKRFNQDQEQVRAVILHTLFLNTEPKFLEMWKEKLDHLRALWKLSSKARESASYSSYWNQFAQAMIDKALLEWKADEGPTEMTVFFQEEVYPSISLPRRLTKAAKVVDGVDSKLPDHLKPKKLHGENLESAAKWVLQTMVPLTGDSGSPVETFWDVITEMGAMEEENGYERRLWERWSFIGEWWKALVRTQGTNKQKAMQFLFIDLVHKLCDRQFLYSSTLDTTVTDEGFSQPADPRGPWFAPLECAEYNDAVKSLLRQIESGEIPSKEGSVLLLNRIKAVIQLTKTRASEEVFVAKGKGKGKDGCGGGKGKGKGKGKCGKGKGKGGVGANIGTGRVLEVAPAWLVSPRLRRLSVENIKGAMKGGKGEGGPQVRWVEGQEYDIQKTRRHVAIPWASYHCKDDVASLELECFSKILSRATELQQVLWTLADVAARVAGPAVSDLLERALAGLNPKIVGMSRVISRNFPYLNQVQSKEGLSKGSSDVLTPLLELWLLDDRTRDERVAKLMSRDDAHYFLFFGMSFGRHLSNCRQEWLHQCLEKLRPFEFGEKPEFYHYDLRGPTLKMLAKYGQGWRGALNNSNPKEVLKAVQMYLWHPKTQTQFLQKALYDTEDLGLALTTQPEYADAISAVSKVLDRYPSERTQAVDTASTADPWGWEVIQAASAYSDLSAEIEKRFLEGSPPAVEDQVEDAQVEFLLTCMGRADDAGQALKVLVKYAGKVKQAKEAMTKMVCQLSPPQARVVIRDVMLKKSAGIGVMTAGLKHINDLNIPKPLELYKVAWNKGRCQRNVLSMILAQVSKARDLDHEEVRPFFNFFDLPDREDDQTFVADSVLDMLQESADWTLPFIPGVVGKLAMLPGKTKKAQSTLLSNTSFPTEVLQALTGIMQTARLADRVPIARASTNTAEAEGRQLLDDLRSLIAESSVRSTVSSVLQTVKTDECDHGALLSFVKEILQCSMAGGTLPVVLQLWSKLLCSKQDSAEQRGGKDTWPGIIADMERYLVDRTTGSDQLDKLAVLTVAVATRVGEMDLSVEDSDDMLASVRAFHERVLTQYLMESPLPKPEGSADPAARSMGDSAFQKIEEDKFKRRTQLVTVTWADMLAHGCSEAESAALFKHCPEQKEAQLASNLVTAAVKFEKQVREQHDKVLAGHQAEKDGSWAHADGKPVSAFQCGQEVSGKITNSSATFGTFVNFGCQKDGRLKCPTSDWKKYRVGDSVDRLVINKIEQSGKTGTHFIELIKVSSRSTNSTSAAGARSVGRRAVQWFAGPAELRESRWNTLAKLWADVVALDRSGFEESLGLLGSPQPQQRRAVDLVENILSKSQSKELTREALTWLGKQNPKEAVRLWPALLQPKKWVFSADPSKLDQVELQDVVAMLKLCEVGSCPVPAFSAVAARGLSEEILTLLIKSPLAEARLVVIQALQEKKSKGSKPPQMLSDLKADPCRVVAVSAKTLWIALGGPEDEKADGVGDDQEEQEDQANNALSDFASTFGGGKGKDVFAGGKGKGKFGKDPLWAAVTSPAGWLDGKGKGKGDFKGKGKGW